MKMGEGSFERFEQEARSFPKRVRQASGRLSKIKEGRQRSDEMNETIRLVLKLQDLESQIEARENPDKNDPFGIYKKRVDNNTALKLFGLTPKQRLKKRAEALAKKIEKRLGNQNQN